MTRWGYLIPCRRDRPATIGQHLDLTLVKLDAASEGVEDGWTTSNPSWQNREMTLFYAAGDLTA